MEGCVGEKMLPEKMQLINFMEDEEQRFITLVSSIIVNSTLRKYEDRKSNNISKNINREAKQL